MIVCDILGFGIFNDVGPILSRQLDNHGIKSSYSNPPDAGSRQVAGEAVFRPARAWRFPA